MQATVFDGRDRARISRRYPLARREPLAHPTRRGILDTVRTRPGCSARQLAEALGADTKTVLHHANVLVALGCIELRAEGGRRWFFPREGPAAPKRVLAAGATAARVIAHVLERPGSTAADLGETLGFSVTTARWHVQRLVQRGILVEAGAGYAVAPRERDAVRAGLGMRGTAAE